MVGKAQKSHGVRFELHGGCSNGVLQISVSASIANFQSRNAEAPLILLRHPKKGSFKTTVTSFSKSGWSVVRSASLAKGGTSKKRPSPHLRKFPNFANGPRTWSYNYTLSKCFQKVVLNQEMDKSSWRGTYLSTGTTSTLSRTLVTNVYFKKTRDMYYGERINE
jgi:hypothetical protein